MPMLLPDNTVTGVYSKDVFKHYKQIAMIAQADDTDYTRIRMPFGAAVNTAKAFILNHLDHMAIDAIY